MPTRPRRPRCAALASGALDLETHAIVDDLQLDCAPPRANAHRDVRRAGVLADIRERLLDRAEDGDALGGRERVRVAADLELGLHTRSLREAVDLAMQDLAERPRDDALRLQRVGDFAELPIELDEAPGEIVEAAMRLLAIVLEDERVDLLLQELDVGCEGEHVLDRPVVQVESQAHEPALRRAR